MTAMPNPPPPPKAVVLVSGGLDSTTALAIAKSQGFHCYALSFDYGQRHRSELRAAERVARDLGAIEHKIIKLDLGAIGGSALTDPLIPIPQANGPGVPVTYVPARNTVFLALALGWAEVIEASDIFIGVNAVDYSGYPDCRPEFITAFEHLANLGTKAGASGKPFKVQTPLIKLTKAEIIRAGLRLGLDYATTVSCYAADPQGRACGKCDSCSLRMAGFQALGIPDPAVYVE